VYAVRALRASPSVSARPARELGARSAPIVGAGGALGDSPRRRALGAPVDARRERRQSSPTRRTRRAGSRAAIGRCPSTCCVGWKSARPRASTRNAGSATAPASRNQRHTASNSPRSLAQEFGDVWQVPRAPVRPERRRREEAQSLGSNEARVGLLPQKRLEASERCVRRGGVAAARGAPARARWRRAEGHRGRLGRGRIEGTMSTGATSLPSPPADAACAPH
jgi:hypothetical protein